MLIRARRYSALGVMLGALVMGGCAQRSYVWLKPGAKDNEFSVAKYDCLQKAQQPYSSTAAYNSGGIVSPTSYSTNNSSAGIATNEQLFNACMNAKGWALSVQGPQSYTPPPMASPEDASRRCEGRGLKPNTYPFNECVKSLSGGK